MDKSKIIEDRSLYEKLMSSLIPLKQAFALSAMNLINDLVDEITEGKTHSVYIHELNEKYPQLHVTSKGKNWLVNYFGKDGTIGVEDSTYNGWDELYIYEDITETSIIDIVKYLTDTINDIKSGSLKKEFNSENDCIIRFTDTDEA